MKTLTPEASAIYYGKSDMSRAVHMRVMNHVRRLSETE